MTKFKPEELTWVAIHDDKIVDYPNYIDIDRKKLKEIQLRHNGEVVFSMKSPKKLFMRLRTYGLKPDNGGKKVWIVGNSSPLEYYIIDEETTEKYDSWGPIPRHKVEFRDDEC